MLNKLSNLVYFQTSRNDDQYNENLLDFSQLHHLQCLLTSGGVITKNSSLPSSLRVLGMIDGVLLPSLTNTLHLNHIPHLNNILHLNISLNQDIENEHLQSFVQLQSLRARNTNITNVNMLPQLTFLDITSTLVTDEGIAELKNLRIFHFEFTKIKSIIHLKQLEEVFANNSIHTHHIQAPNLRVLSTSHVSGNFTPFVKLTTLCFSGRPLHLRYELLLNNKSLASLVNLTTLDLSSFDNEDMPALDLKPYPKLEYLNIKYETPGYILQESEGNTPSLKTLYVSYPEERIGNLSKGRATRRRGNTSVNLTQAWERYIEPFIKHLFPEDCSSHVIDSYL